MHKQVSIQLTSNSKFLSEFSRKPLSGISDQKAPLPPNGKLQIWDDQSLLQNTPLPKWKTSDLRWPKFTPKYPPPNGKLQIWDDQSLLRNTPQNGKLQIWDDQSLLWNTTPPMENLRFEMTKVYSKIPPPNGKLQIWDDQSLLQNTPPPKSCWWEYPYVETYIYHTDSILVIALLQQYNIKVLFL